MFSPNAQVLGLAQVISDVIRTSVLASESESGHGKAADEPRVQNHVLYTFLPCRCKSCLFFVYVPDKLNIV
jgi:hypothetical protein